MYRGMGKKALALVAALSATAALTACGTSKTTGATAGSGASTQTSSNGTPASRATARKAVADYVGHPSAFPVTEKLNQPLRGKTVAFMSEGNPVSSLIGQYTAAALKQMGATQLNVNAGTSASTVTAAFNSMVAKRPAGVLVPGIDPSLFAKQLKQLQAAKVPVVDGAITNGPQYGLKTVQSGPADNERVGKLLANYVTGYLASGSKATIAVYDVPEVPAIAQVAHVVVKQMKQLCPGCRTRLVHVPLATLGSTAPSTVVSDLQAHSGTSVAVFADDEIEIGLPEALSKAGIKVKTLGYVASPANFAYIKAGQETAALGDSVPIYAYTLVDQLAREVDGQSLAGLEAKGFGVYQFLTQKDITFNPKVGWTGYPNYAQRFAKLWGVGGQ